jgi:hypothetical protein
MRTRTTAATGCLLLAVGLALTGCSSNSHTDAKPTATSTTTRATSAAPPPVKLSATWGPQIEALAAGPGADACASDSGSDDCAQAITASLTLFNQMIKTIVFGNPGGEYLQTTTELSKLGGAAEIYVKDKCSGHPLEGSPCQKNAIAVTAHLADLQEAMQTDEQTFSAT